MTRLLSKLLLQVGAGLGLLLGLAGTARSQSAAVGQAEDLVRRALWAEVAGQAKVRSDLLQAAVRTAPDYAPAQWHRGYVRVGDEWLPVPDAERQAAPDSRWPTRGTGRWRQRAGRGQRLDVRRLA